MEPQKEATILVARSDMAKSFAGSSGYASIRSPMLREALERKEAPDLSKFDGAPIPKSTKTTEMRNLWEVEDRLSELSLLSSCDDDLESKYPKVQSPDQGTHENSDSLPRAERLRRARAGKRRADLYALGQNPRLEVHAKTEAESAFKGDTESVLGSALEIVSTVLDELERRRNRSAAPDMSPSNKGESSPHYAPPLTDEISPPDAEVYSYEADISDNYDSAVECAPLRRTRRRSAHSRLTTPLGLYDPRHKPTRG